MTGSASNFLLITILVLMTIVVVFDMKYVSPARQTRSRTASEDAYRELARKSAQAQSASAAALAMLQADVTELKTRLVSVETVLKEVG